MKKLMCIIGLLVLFCGSAYAEDPRITVALSYGIFNPVNSTVKDKFDDSWSRWAITSFDPDKPDHWRFIFEVGSYKLDGDADVSMIPVSVGFEKGIGANMNLRPYVAARVGPYFGSVTDPSVGLDEDHIGTNANVAFGVVFNRRYFAEVRYDYFSEMAGYDLSGYSISAGIKLFTVKL